MVRIVICLLVVASALSCSQSSDGYFSYGTSNDSALFYFNKGWEQILDLGQWTLSERSFRKAIEFDNSFVIGKSLVGRISQDLEERQMLLQELEKLRDSTWSDERLLLNIFISNIRIMNLRASEAGVTKEARENHLALAERNFREFIQKYPKESYMKAEYVETIHALYGPQRALDSLNSLVTERQSQLPFFIRYKALLSAELGKFEEAILLAQQLKETINDPTIPEPHVLAAEIYFKMDSLHRAKPIIDHAVGLDPNHLIAQGLRSQIIDQLDVEI